MSDNVRIEAAISGPNRESAEAAVNDFIKEQFNAAPERGIQNQSGAQTRGGDLIEWITLVLSVPAALMTTLDLAERVKLKERVQRLLERVRSAGTTAEESVLLTIEEQPAIDLTRASVSEVVDALNPSRRT
jgi:hypothetical protein